MAMATAASFALSAAPRSGNLDDFGSAIPFHANAPPRRRTTAIRATGAATKRAKTPAEEDWRIKREALKKNQVRSITAKDAKRLQDEQGYVLLDVRPQNEFQKMHPIGAVNVEIYRLIKEWTAWDIARRLGFAFFGIFDGTEENPNFLADVRAKVESKSKVIVACASGGTMKPTPTLADGQQSRSLIAAYVLLMDSYTNVLHLEGGLRSWYQDRLPTEEASE
ncbi:hypothetical protein SELMODRAFT_174737 [Selaginella moellendorffii]|uniref:Rhodanese domain-containing protein n=1 Tax=Selaginella moellendorffii TaxID=88036 RepID=D8RVR4_SELML|nr:rhodanese-like domain-containing protein 14, chloroplastic [Selaginella moellendorffii]EFJ23821.1 hypothetical protein SELMODRAFT_174737 [Selaginella moellendorffii]|eukprot:XP_002975036.1 rhodanese-like domain-containing protein 14, chloroplastic [Selaginella moellendorffii]